MSKQIFFFQTMDKCRGKHNQANPITNSYEYKRSSDAINFIKKSFEPEYDPIRAIRYDEGDSKLDVLE